MNKALLSLLVLALLWSTSSCNLYRRIRGRKVQTVAADSSLVAASDTVLPAKDATAHDSGTTAMGVKPDSLQVALKQQMLPLWNAQTAWTTFNGKAALHYEAKGESQDLSATIRMEKGKGVWVSVIALGLFEAARILIRPDTIFILDRVHKEAHILPFSESGSLLPVRADFASLQCLIVGDVLQTGHELTNVADSASAIILSHISPVFAQSLQYDKADLMLRFQRLDTASTSLLCEYSNRDQQDAKKFARSRSITMSDKGETYILNLVFSKAEFDQPVELPFAIPEKYERK